MVNKILKKITGVFGYKLVEKNLIKNNRLIVSKSKINLNFILKKIFNNQKIKCLIQIGANDGSRFDEISKFIKDYKIKSILVEPVQEYFEDSLADTLLKDGVSKSGLTIKCSLKDDKLVFSVKKNKNPDPEQGKTLVRKEKEPSVQP